MGFVIDKLNTSASLLRLALCLRIKRDAVNNRHEYLHFFISPEPSGPPQDVKALTKSSTSILVKWSPPHELDRNGIITHYIVKYNVSRGTEANISTPDNSTQILVRPLRKYASYYFTVQAVNKIGVGPPSVAVVNTTFEDCEFTTCSE